MCRSGNAQAMMKGSLHTDELMKVAMQRDTGLRTSRRITHVFVMDTPAYARTLLITDAAINIKPEFEDKIHIVQNAIDLAHALGIPGAQGCAALGRRDGEPQDPFHDGSGRAVQDGRPRPDHRRHPRWPAGLRHGRQLKAAKIKHLNSPVTGQADISSCPISKAATCSPSNSSISAARS